MKKTIASVLCVVLLIGILFAGCGSNAPATIEGKWKGQIDMASAMNTMLAEAGENAGFPDMEFSNIALPIHMEFTADGKCTMSISDTDVESMVTAIIDQMVPALESYVEGMGMSLDDLLTLSGMSKDDFINQLVSSLTDSMDLSSLNKTEKYKVENGVLYIDEDLEDLKEEDGNPYTLEGNKLTIQAGTNDEGAEFMFPLVLERVN